MMGNGRIDELFAVRLERSQSTRFVLTQKAALADYVGSQDRSEATLHTCFPFAVSLAV